MSQVLAKGVNFLYSKRFIESNYGAEIWERVMNSLPRDAQDVWSEGVLANRSYPFSAFKAMLSALTTELGSAEESEIAKIYEYIADSSLNKIHKLFFRHANPSLVIQNYPKLWHTFFNTGNVQVALAEKGEAILKFVLPEIFLDWLTPACLGIRKKR